MYIAALSTNRPWQATYSNALTGFFHIKNYFDNHAISSRDLVEASNHDCATFDDYDDKRSCKIQIDGQNQPLGLLLVPFTLTSLSASPR